jgi:transcription antitermination factor NusG
MEQELVFFLLQTAAPRHELRSAFMRNSISGWVYLEATMNEDLVRHLRLSPGVVRRHGGIIREQVDFADWTKVLSAGAHNSATDSNLAVGNWVQVCKGAYKGDVGYVAAIENWGGVSLLLVPCLPGPHHPGSSPSKRKRSTTPPEPTLFDPLAIKRIHGVDPVWQELSTYRFKGHTFEYGLILKAFDLHSISSTSVYIPTRLLFLYRSADHPALTTTMFPRPLEWCFAEGEEVWLHRSHKRGFIKAVEDTFAEVDFHMEGGIVCVPWSELVKEFQPGEYIEIMGGPFQGQSGWVVGSWNNVVRVIVENSSGATEVQDVKVGLFFNSWDLN